MENCEIFELLSYVVTVIGFPFAILVYVLDKRSEREIEEAEIHRNLTDGYQDFLKLVLDNSDLQLLSRNSSRQPLTPEQEERRFALFGILVALFENAFILVYDDHMTKQQQRLWRSWEDYFREWCRREEFRQALPDLLLGEDEEFKKYLTSIVNQELSR